MQEKFEHLKRIQEINPLILIIDYSFSVDGLIDE